MRTCPACGSTEVDLPSDWIGGGLIGIFWSSCLGLIIGTIIGAAVGMAMFGMIGGLLVGAGVPVLMIVSGIASRGQRSCLECGHEWTKEEEEARE